MLCFVVCAIIMFVLKWWQAAWWGHPITSGIESIDFFFSLEDELPAADSHYSEQLVRFDTVNSMNVLPVMDKP